MTFTGITLLSKNRQLLVFDEAGTDMGAESRVLALVVLTSMMVGCSFTSINDAPVSPTWADCGSGQFSSWFDQAPPGDLQCALLTVPLAYRVEHGQIKPEDDRRIELAMTRLPALQGNDGDIVFVSGGPGLAGISLPFAYDSASLKALRNRHDLIGYDPRGVGRSLPAVRCVGPVEQTSDQSLAGYVAGCIEGSGLDLLRHVGTHEAVQDLEWMRQVLQLPALRAVGYSYGTKVVQLYALRFPQAVAGLVVDGVVDLEEDGFSQLMSQAKATSAALERFLDWCAEDCSSGSGSSSAHEWVIELLQGLEEHPVTLDDGTLLDPDTLLSEMSLLLFWSSGWSSLRQLVQVVRRGETPVGLLRDTDSADALIAISCADTAPRDFSPEQRALRLQQAAEVLAATSLRQAGDDLDFNLCEYWPFPGGDQPMAVLPSPRLPPLLFIISAFDPTTPAGNAQRMAAAFRSPLVILQGIGHTSALSGSSDCVDNAVVEYFRAPALFPGALKCEINPGVDIVHMEG